MHLLEKKNFLSIFYCIFDFYIKFLKKKKKKNEPHSLRFSEVIDVERRAYLNIWKVLFLKTVWQWTCYVIGYTIIYTIILQQIYT